MMSSARVPYLNLLTSYQPLPAEYQRADSASPAHRLIVACALGVLIAAVIFAATGSKKRPAKPVAPRTSDAPKAPVKRANDEQADILEKSRRLIKTTRDIERANPEKAGA